MNTYHLREWIKDKPVNWYFLSSNPNAIKLLEANPDKIYFREFCKNPNAIHFLSNNKDKICGRELSKNPNAGKLLKENYRRCYRISLNWNKIWRNPSLFNEIMILRDMRIFFISDTFGCMNVNKRIDWHRLSSNPNAIEFLTINQDKINWEKLASNKAAINLLTANQDKIDWKRLSKNPNAIELLTVNPNKIDWSNLSKNPNAINLLTANPDKIDWYNLSMNPNAIELLKTNPDKIDWNSIWHNPSIFTFDYDTIKKNKHDLHKELIEYLYHPNKIAKHLEVYNDLDSYLM